ncbi:ATP12 family chaperone protein [Pseudoroseicyclus tamaricis]|uniref:ATPase n=1 Tax=Pseudoroseicyclus tamaricis TaxID=2705421 RepID=A0A6B2K1C0_9RHOB|nr:ATP12 family protein [Pseudoroseicyclus tamaricis]NDV02244.1 ATPase [Pseudoroseicyclus tamaricis]
MTEWAAKVFWSEVATEETAEGWQVTLDGRPIRTPGKHLLALPTAALAERVAEEWRAQDGQIRPETMPATRTANSAIEKVAPQQADVSAMLAGYGGTDLICYRADAPAELVSRQAAAWDPMIAWAAESLQAPLNVTAGVMAVDQPASSLTRLHARVEELGIFRLAAFHDLVALSGSLVLALAVLDGRLGAEAAWTISRIDEAWQEEQWGPDEEAAAATATRREAFLNAAAFLAAAGER